MKPNPKHQHQKYRQLLIVLLATFVISPFFQTGLGNILPVLLLLYTIIVIIKGFGLPRGWVVVYGAIALIASGLQIFSELSLAASYNQSFSILSQAIFVIYLGSAAYWIGQDIWRTPDTTADTVRGGISVYLLLGFVWALLYGIVSTLEPDAFSPPLFEFGEDSYLKALHFSFTTLTTLGYGDIVPVSDVALVLTNLEAIIGQMYVTIFIATLVGGYLSGRSHKRF
ncbi:MAG: potassium channel family protein [Cyanobacteria bacterium P01_F01_bin.53]